MLKISFPAQYMPQSPTTLDHRLPYSLIRDTHDERRDLHATVDQRYSTVEAQSISEAHVDLTNRCLSKHTLTKHSTSARQTHARSLSKVCMLPSIRDPLSLVIPRCSTKRIPRRCRSSSCSNQRSSA